MNKADKSLSFGIQNFFIVATDESDGTYNYYGYSNQKGSILIMRTNKAATSLLYFATSKETFTVAWAAKATKTYVVPSSLVLA